MTRSLLKYLTDKISPINWKETGQRKKLNAWLTLLLVNKHVIFDLFATRISFFVINTKFKSTRKRKNHHKLL